MQLKKIVLREMGELADEKDHLTGLPNRQFMEHYATNLLNLSRDNKQAFTFYLVDIDNFKRFNDIHGHDAGDKILKNVAETLDSILYEDAVAGRWGGEEFAVVDTGGKCKSERIANEIVNYLADCAAAAHCTRPNGKEEDLTVSVGYATHNPGDLYLDENGHSARSTVLKSLRGKADQALFYSKFNGRNQANEFTPELNASFEEARVTRKYLAGLVDHYVDEGKITSFDLYPEGLDHVDHDGQIVLIQKRLSGGEREHATTVGDLYHNTLSRIINHGKHDDTRYIFGEADRLYQLAKNTDPKYMRFSIPEFRPNEPVLTK